VVIFSGDQLRDVLSEMIDEPGSVLQRLLYNTKEMLYKERFHVFVRENFSPLRVFELCDSIVCPMIHSGFMKEFCVSFSLFNPLYP